MLSILLWSNLILNINFLRKPVDNSLLTSLLCSAAGRVYQSVIRRWDGDNHQQRSQTSDTQNTFTSGTAVNSLLQHCSTAALTRTWLWPVDWGGAMHWSMFSTWPTQYRVTIESQAACSLLAAGLLCCRIFLTFFPPLQCGLFVQSAGLWVAGRELD